MLGKNVDGLRITAENGLVGLALSGGGQRSAAFCLGVLQGLQSKDFIKHVDYLSTVSGGGYIGSTLTLGLSDNPNAFPFGTPADAKESAIVKHLRDNSRYLVPNGLWSVVTAFVVYARGLVSNALAIVPILLMISALLLALNSNTAELRSTRALFIDWSAVIGSGTLRVSQATLVVILAALALYAVLVSVISYSSKHWRTWGSNVAAVVLTIAFVIIMLDLHAALSAWWFRQSNSAGMGLASEFAKLQTFFVWLSPIVAVVLPYINGIASKATSGDAGGWSEIAKRVASRALLLIVAGLLPAILWIAIVQMTFWGTALCDGMASCSGLASVAHAPRFVQWMLGADETGQIASYSRWWAATSYTILAGALLASWPFLNVNANSLHQLYRDRLGNAFFVRAVVDVADTYHADILKLSAINTENAPYHLINAALNVPGSSFANRRGRNADFFFFSPRYVGSEASGYARTSDMEDAMKSFSLGTATAVSGAAAAPNMGMASVRPLSLTIALLNVRLGYWIRHPRHVAQRKQILKKYPGPVFMLSEAFSRTGIKLTKRDVTKSETGFVFLTDGGHIDNLGVYGLLRRRCKIIFAVDGEADPTMAFTSLVQLERLARIDLNVTIDLPWEKISRFALNWAAEPTFRPHVAIGTVKFPASGPGAANETGVIVYIKSSMSGDECDYIRSYAAAHRTFPHESTGDQVFSEEQFEVYRALGEHIAVGLVTGRDAVVLSEEGDPLEAVKKAVPGIEI
ncbi:patatin-like phospholipase family protein [Rhizobium lemnae]|uniref:Patatin-like phospholipase family protein n=1 Tax=Rhizobium lemnae TaxID=1214924 RepID=A0ABV8EAC0_9HYPH|nr:patatin-like phospholipase family protein [Rhizobium lemnae]